MDPRAAIERLRTPEGWLTASAPEGRFASLFGRDALVSALQLLPVDPSIAHATLEPPTCTAVLYVLVVNTGAAYSVSVALFVAPSLIVPPDNASELVAL